MAAAVQGTTEQVMVSQYRGDRNCFRCGGSGYFKSDYPKNRGTEKQRNRFPRLSPCCKKGGHWANECDQKQRISHYIKNQEEVGGVSLRPPNILKQLMGHEAAAKPRKSISELNGATPGSAGLNLGSTTYTKF